MERLASRWPPTGAARFSVLLGGPGCPASPAPAGPISRQAPAAAASCPRLCAGPLSAIFEPGAGAPLPHFPPPSEVAAYTPSVPLLGMVYPKLVMLVASAGKNNLSLFLDKEEAEAL